MGSGNNPILDRVSEGPILNDHTGVTNTTSTEVLIIRQNQPEPPNLENQPEPPNLDNFSDHNFETKWGSFHCTNFENGGKCDLCDHMIEKEMVYSSHFGTYSRVHGHLSHDKSPPGFLRWFIYSIEDVPCQQRIVGSTTNPYNRWSNYKSHCNKKNSNSTGLSKHFKEGCPNDTGSDKSTLDFTLLDFYDTTDEKLKLANHVPGPKCRCIECEKLKNVEDFWIMRLGTFYKGFNTRDEVKAKSRYNWK